MNSAKPFPSLVPPCLCNHPLVQNPPLSPPTLLYSAKGNGTSVKDLQFQETPRYSTQVDWSSRLLPFQSSLSTVVNIDTSTVFNRMVSSVVSATTWFYPWLNPESLLAMTKRSISTQQVIFMTLTSWQAQHRLNPYSHTLLVPGSVGVTQKRNELYVSWANSKVFWLPSSSHVPTWMNQRVPRAPCCAVPVLSGSASLIILKTAVLASVASACLTSLYGSYTASSSSTVFTSTCRSLWIVSPSSLLFLSPQWDCLTFPPLPNRWSISHC